MDGGSTATDSGELERERGITIRSAVASFTTERTQINLVDTPGHPDFIAEVERALQVLDGAVLVVSAVEGVQAQTRVLMRSLRKMRLPTLVFVNKTDRPGARHDDLLREIETRLGLRVVPLASGFDRRRTTEILAERDDELLARFLTDVLPTEAELGRAVRNHDDVVPLLRGSAITGAGVREVTDAIEDLIPTTIMGDGEPAGIIFAVERAAQREKIAYLRLFAGSLHGRQRIVLRRDGEEYEARIGRLEVIGGGPLTAGNIAKVRGLPKTRVGDRIGEVRSTPNFAPPILETVVRPVDEAQKGSLHAALTMLSDEDPLIRTRTTDTGDTSVLLFGAVQREVIGERLKREFGIDTVFDAVRPILVERVQRRAEARIAFVPHAPNEFWQTVALRVEPGRGVEYETEVEAGLIPKAYYRAIEQSVRKTLGEGREVTDCRVTLTEVDCVAPMSSAGDFRVLTARVLRKALEKAETRVYEPTYAIEVETPRWALSGVVGFLAGAETEVTATTEGESGWVVEGVIPVRRLPEVGIALPGLTGGRGSLIHEPGPDRAVSPARP